MPTTLLLVGTRKGLWVARSDDDRRTWQVDGPSFVMNAVYAVALDTRGDRTRLLVSADSEHWGPSVFRSDDLGATEGSGRAQRVQGTRDPLLAVAGAGSETPGCPLAGASTKPE